MQNPLKNHTDYVSFAMYAFVSSWLSAPCSWPLSHAQNVEGVFKLMQQDAVISGPLFGSFTCFTVQCVGFSDTPQDICRVRPAAVMAAFLRGR
jgi:hypothetical protein